MSKENGVERRLREKVLALALAFRREGLLERTWGNFSMRLDERTCLITPSGRAYESLSPEDIVAVDLVSGQACSGARWRPSSESPIHVAAYRQRPEIRAIAHAHQPYATALAFHDLQASAEESHLLGAEKVPCVAYAPPGSPALHQAVAAALTAEPELRAFLLARHGTLLLAQTDTETLALARLLEDFCRQRWQQVTGIEAPPYQARKILPNLQWGAIGGARQTDVQLLAGDPVLTLFFAQGPEAYLDDYAQLCGTGAAGLYPDEVSGRVLCRAQTLDEAEALRGVLLKNARAAVYARQLAYPPLPLAEVERLHLDYKSDYARRAEE